jgi:hypothetical protein
MDKNIMLSPYSGIGYRFKSDESEEVKCNDGDILGFYRKSNGSVASIFRIVFLL